jgi:hypothetical protein
VLEEGEGDSRRIENDSDDDDDELLINLLYIVLQPSDKGYANRDYSNKEYTDGEQGNGL